MSKKWLIVWAAVMAAASLPVSAQVPTADQLEILKSLSPEQREALERQLGVEPGASSQPERNDSSRDDAAKSTVRVPISSDPQAEEELLESSRRVLRADDSLIIEIDFELLPVRDQNENAERRPTTSQPAILTPTTPPTADADVIRYSPLGRQLRQLSDEDRTRLEELRELIRSRNPYRLSRDGQLQLPGFAPISLAGLTEAQAALRMSVEPALRDFDLRITRLPLKRIGTEALKPFGYELFERNASTFAPVTDIPVPVDYVVGAGDQFQVQLYGSQNRTMRLTVGRDGRINFPELGPISVTGRRFAEVKSSIEARVALQMIGVRASVSMGEPHGIRVFVLGEARRPGSYTISGLGTITSALFAAGGVEPIGSLRNVELRRQGALVRRFDLYDMLIRGDTTDDAKLLPGDVVFIPPSGPTVSVAGEVRRPAIYETRTETTIAELVNLAGGLTAEADTAKASLTRIDEAGRRVVLAVTLGGTNNDSQRIRNGDLLRISRLRPTLDAGIVLDGHVHAPGVFPHREGMRLTDVLHSVDDLMPNGDPHYVLIRRELPPDRRIVVLSADLAAALADPESAANVPLMPRDRLMVFNLEAGRDRVIEPLLEELRLQSNFDHPTDIVHIDGRVKVAGDYPLEHGMTVRDLVRAGGSLSDAAYGGTAELTRYQIVNGESRRTQLLALDLAAAVRGDPAANVLLQPFDTLTIKTVPDWAAKEVVTIRGQVRFPGTYPIAPGETMRSLMARAGGLSELAFPAGSVFTRKELRLREQQQVDVLASRLQNDLAILAFQGAIANQTQAGTQLSVGQSLLAQIRGAKAVGRLVIDLPRVLSATSGSPDDIVLRDGDELLVPRKQQEVTVIGEVQSPTSHLFRAEFGRDDYIGLSGGMTRKADKDKVYVVRADGSVVANSGGNWFSRGSQAQIRAGDTVVVPLDAERLPALPFWQAVTQIIYNLAISAAAVNSF
ncbi:MAG TPA: SLBB domain-containing protein [Steroidobacteraceae bacterium]|nr:SLBB domain-containing protein [Steroidobacteraceae bacterium]